MTVRLCLSLTSGRARWWRSTLTTWTARQPGERDGARLLRHRARYGGDDSMVPSQRHWTRRCMHPRAPTGGQHRGELRSQVVPIHSKARSWLAPANRARASRLAVTPQARRASGRPRLASPAQPNGSWHAASFLHLPSATLPRQPFGVAAACAHRAPAHCGESAFRKTSSTTFSSFVSLPNTLCSWLYRGGSLDLCR